MSYKTLTSILRTAKLRSNDRIWFAKWLDGYRRFYGVGPNDSIPISRDSVIDFLRQQKASGRQAWQRLQMVKAIQFYQTSVLRNDSTELDDVREALAEFVRRVAQVACNLGHTRGM